MPALDTCIFRPNASQSVSPHESGADTFANAIEVVYVVGEPVSVTVVRNPAMANQSPSAAPSEEVFPIVVLVGPKYRNVLFNRQLASAASV